MADRARFMSLALFVALTSATAFAQGEPPPPMGTAPELTSPDEVAPLDVPPLEVSPMGAAPTVDDGSALAFDAGLRAKEVCSYDGETQTYGCDTDMLKRFNVLSVLRVAPPSTATTPLSAKAKYDDEDGCLLAIEVDFATSASERRVSWKTSTLVIGGKEADFYVKSSSGDIEPGWETGTLIVANAPLKESVVGRKGGCLVDVLSDEQEQDMLFLDVEIEEGGSLAKQRIEITRRWTSTTLAEAARALPEPTEPLPSAYWPWIVGGLGVCGVGGCCAGPTCLLSTVFGGAATFAALGVALQNSAVFTLAGLCGLYGGILSLYGIVPSALIGIVVGLITGGLSGWGIAELGQSTFPDDKESDARWLAWREFRKKHGVPVPPLKSERPLVLPAPSTTAMAH